MSVLESGLLEMVAEFVVEERLAVVFSQRIDGNDDEAGKKGRQGWNFADPWPRGNQRGLHAQLVAHHGKRNLLVVTQPSKVITIDCDTEAGLELYRSLGLPPTTTIRSGRDGAGFHFIHRPPCEGLEYTFFELAGDEEPQVTGAVRNKLHVISGIHKSGRHYELWPSTGIAQMPLEAYRKLSDGYALRSRAVREGIAYDGERVAHPGRHAYLVSRASDYADYLGHRGEVLAAHLRVDWDFGCEHEPVKPDIDEEIAKIVAHYDRGRRG